MTKKEFSREAEWAGFESIEVLYYLGRYDVDVWTT